MEPSTLPVSPKGKDQAAAAPDTVKSEVVKPDKDPAATPTAQPIPAADEPGMAALLDARAAKNIFAAPRRFTGYAASGDIIVLECLEDVTPAAAHTTRPAEDCRSTTSSSGPSHVSEWENLASGDEDPIFQVSA